MTVRRPPRFNKPPKTGLAPRPNLAQFSGRNNDASKGTNGSSKREPRDRANPRRDGNNGVQGRVSDEIRAGVDSLRQDRRIVRRQAKKDRQMTLNDYRRSLGDLNYIYGETGDYIQNMGGQINQNYNDQASRTAAAQQAFVASLQGNSQAVGGGLSSELSRLGLEGTDNSQFMADAQNSLNVAGQTGVNNMANLGLQQQGANDITGLLGGMVQGSHLSNVGLANNAKNDMLYDIYQTKQEGYNKVAEAISDLKGTRGDLTKQLMEQLSRSQWGKHLARKRRGHSGGYNSGSSGGGKPIKAGGSGSNAGGNTLADLLAGALNS